MCWTLYLFLFLCLMVAHYVAAGQIIANASKGDVTYWQAVLLFLICTWPIVAAGTRFVDRVNFILMIGLVLTYALFVIFSLSHIQIDFLKVGNWGQSWFALPVIFTAFGYQILIPTLFNYLHRSARRMRKAIVIGTFIPLAIYVIWQALISGVIPSDILKDANAKGQNALIPLSQILNNKYILGLGNTFGLITLIASYMGISISFLDFLADGFSVRNRGLVKFWLCCGIFLLPTIVSLTDPGLFLNALGYAGGIGCNLLLGILPVAMVWSARKKDTRIHKQFPGGKPLLSALLVFALLVLITQLA